MSENTSLIPVERIERAILLIRGEKVMLDSDLADIYGVETGALNRAVKRNAVRFPTDFMFRLTAGEAKLASQTRGEADDTFYPSPSPNQSQFVTGSPKYRDP